MTSPMVILLLLSLSFVSIFVSLAPAQDAAAPAMDLGQMGTTVLQQKAGELVARKDWVNAIAFLKELVNRLEKTENPTLKENLKDCLYFLGIAQMSIGKTPEAIDAFGKVIEKWPKDSKARLALNLRGDCYRRTEQWSDAAAAYEKLRAEYPMEPEPLMGVNVKLADCYIKSRLWEKALPILELVFRDKTISVDIRTKAATALAQAYIERDRVEDLLALVPVLQQRGSRARYEAAFNLALVQGGDKMFYKKDYITALLLYQLAIPKEDLLKWYDDLEVTLQKELEQPVLPGQGSADRPMELAEELQKIKGQRESLKEAEDYTEELRLRIARTFFEMGRKHESFWTFWSIWKDFPKSELAEQGLYGAFSLSAEMGDYDRALELGFAYMKDYEKADRFDEVSLQLGQIHIQRKEFDKTIEHYQKTLKIKPNHTYNDQIAFTTGYTLFQMEQFDRALESFTIIRKQYPNSTVRESCDYWIALTYLFKKDYKSAKEDFLEFASKYNAGDYYEDANFRIGVCHYGLLKFDEARKAFETFIRRFPSSTMRGEAHVMLGDIAGAEGQLDEALVQYKEVDRFAENTPAGMVHINYAATQIGKIHEMRKDFKAMEEFFKLYLRKWETKGNYTEAIWRIGFALKQQGKSKEMLDEYWKAIKQYGNDPQAIGIDLIISEWPDQYKSIEGKDPIEPLTEQLREAKKRNQTAMIWRLQMALAKSGDAKAKELQFKDEDLKEASAAVLVWMGDQSKNAEFSRKAYQKVLDNFNGTEWSEPATLKTAESYAATKEYPKAIEHFRLLQERFPTSPNAGVGLKREADIMKEQKKFKDAVPLYEKVLEVKEWRGPLWAESVFQIGDSFFEQKEFKQAFSYFQRVYVLYQNYAEWVAKAYLKSAICLEELHDKEGAVKTYKEMLSIEKLKAFPEYQEAEKRLQKLQ